MSRREFWRRVVVFAAMAFAGVSLAMRGNWPAVGFDALAAGWAGLSCRYWDMLREATDTAGRLLGKDEAQR